HGIASVFILYRRSRRGIAVLATALLWLASQDASARRITADLRRAIELIEKQASRDEAGPFEKFCQLQSREEIPLSKAFVEASIGRDSIIFLDRQIETLEAAGTRRP